MDKGEVQSEADGIEFPATLENLFIEGSRYRDLDPLDSISVSLMVHCIVRSATAGRRGKMEMYWA